MANNEDNYQITKNLDERKLREICNFFKTHDLETFTLIEGELEITLKVTEKTNKVLTMPQEIMTEKVEDPPAAKMTEGTKSTIDGNPITAPISGNFYTSPSPNDPPYIKVGDKVKKGSKICIIEAMKVMNEIPSPVSGTVTAILAENGKPVKQGDLIITIK